MWSSNQRKGVIFRTRIPVVEALFAVALVAVAMTILLLANRRQYLVKRVVALGNAAIHAGLEYGVTDLFRCEAHRERGCRLAALLDQDEGVERLALVPGVVELLGVDDTLGSHDLAIHATHPHLVSVRATPHEAVGASHLQINFADGERPAPADAQPALEQLGLCPCLEDQTTRCIEHASHRDLSVRGCRYFEGCVHHGDLPSLSLLASARLFLALHLLQQVVVALEVALPDLAVPLEPSGDAGERLPLDPPGPPLCVASSRDQSRALQDLEMLGDRGLAHGERCGELGHRRLTRG